MPTAPHNEERSATQGAAGTDLIRCGGCGRRSDPSVRFCGGCGGRMWEPCVDCETANPVDQPFCGGCGARLDESLQAASGEIEAVLAEAEPLADEGRFAEAIKLLEQLQPPAHTRLERLGAAVQARREEYARRREELTATVGDRLAEARRLADEGAPRDALAAAKRVPPALRGLELRQLHDDLESKVGELDRLRGVVKRGLSDKDYGAVFAAVTRLLEIDPRDEKMVSLSQKLSEQRAKIDRGVGRKQAKRALAALKECNYREAEAALAEAPDADYDEKTSKALSTAKERVWLAHQLARAPYVDSTLVAIADRLAKVQPHDEKVAQLRRQVTLRWKEGLKKHPEQAIAWSRSARAAGKATAAPVEVPRDMAEALVSKGHAPRQFLVAYGLALQAAGRAPIDLDLAPKKRGWASRLSLGSGRRKGGGFAWGVDVGSHSLKAVRVAIGDDGPPVFDDAYIAGTSPPKIEPVEGRGSLPAGAELAVRKLLGARDLEGASLAVGLPSPLTLGRFFQLPWLSANKFEEAVRYEAKMRIPLDSEEVYTDYSGQEIEDEDLAGDADGAKLMRVALVAANRKHVDDRIGLFSEAGVGPVSVTPDGAALANAFAAHAGESPGAVALVDVGAKTTTLSVLSAGACWFRGAYAGGGAFDKAVVERLKCSWQKAEELRRKPAKAAWMHEVDGALAPAFESIGELIERTIAQHDRDEGLPVTKVLLGGGGGEQYGLLRELND